MGKFLSGMLYGYSNASRYSKIIVVLLALFGIVSSMVHGAAGVPDCGSYTTPECSCVSATSCAGSTLSASSCTYSLDGGGTATTGDTGSAGGAGPACATFTSAGCAPGYFQCVDTSNAVFIPLCSIYTTVHGSIFLLALALIVLGGILYAGGHVMPGQTKGTLQGYGMGFIFGGIIGSIISIIAPFILSIISGQSKASIIGACST